MSALLVAAAASPLRCKASKTEAVACRSCAFAAGGRALPLHPAPSRRAAGLCPCTRDFFEKKSSKNFITPAGGTGKEIDLFLSLGLKLRSDINASRRENSPGCKSIEKKLLCMKTNEQQLFPFSKITKQIKQYEHVIYQRVRIARFWYARRDSPPRPFGS